MNGARYAFLKRICDLANSDKNVVIVSGDYAAPVFDEFKTTLPMQYVSVGIAEQNLIAVSCGLALGGKRAIAYGLAPFPVTRAYDQIKNTASMMNLPIAIVNSGIGFAIPEWGATHFNTEDIALIRTFPNIRIVTPSDNHMAVETADYILKSQNPVYVRLDKYCEGSLYQNRIVNFQRGFNVLRDGKEAAIITCCYLTHLLLGSDIDAKIIDLYSIPFDSSSLFEDVGSLPIITFEEHILNGGIGSAVLEAANTAGITNSIKRLAIDFDGAYPYTSGSREHFLKKYNLSLADVKNTISDWRQHKQ